MRGWIDDAEAMGWYYEHNLEVTKVFFDWRFKLLSLGLGAASALAAVSATVPKSGDLGTLSAMPALIGVVIALTVVLINERHAHVLLATYKVGAKLEQAEGSWWDGNATPGPFMVLLGPHGEAGTRSLKQRLSLLTFTGIINVLALLIAAVCGATAGIIFAGR